MLKTKLRKKRNKTVELGINSENEHDTDNEYEEPVLKSTQFSSSNSSILKSITENIIYYISGYIVKKLKSIMCYSCVTNLRAAECEHNYLRKKSKFFAFSNYDGLVKPSLSVFLIKKQKGNYKL